MKRNRPDPARIKRAQQDGERARIEYRTRGGLCHVDGCTLPVTYKGSQGGLALLSCNEHVFVMADLG